MDLCRRETNFEMSQPYKGLSDFEQSKVRCREKIWGKENAEISAIRIHIADDACCVCACILLCYV